MYQLYYSPGACSMAIHIVLNELGQKVELKPINLQEPRPADLLKLNPRGQVPVLVDGGFPIREGGAIIAYLLDKHNSPMMPKSGHERATALEWLMFANSSLHPTYSRAFFLMKNVKDEATKTELLNATKEQIEKLWKEVDERLAAQPYVCGKECSAADILLAVIANWGGWLPFSVTLGENVKRMLRETTKRPAYQQALAAEKVEYKAAA